jgi:hypothetical protein
MIRATRQIKCLIAKARGGGGTPYLKWTFWWLLKSSPQVGGGVWPPGPEL